MIPELLELFRRFALVSLLAFGGQDALTLMERTAVGAGWVDPRIPALVLPTAGALSPSS